MAAQDTPFWIFNLAFLVFLSPTLYCLFATHAGWDGHTWEAAVIPFPAGGSPVHFSLFPFVMCILYVLLQLILGQLCWKQKAKSLVQHKDDMVRMFYLNVALAILGRVQTRLFLNDIRGDLRVNCFFLGQVVFYTCFFSILFEMVRGVNLHISSDLLQNMPGLWIFAVSILVLGGTLHAHILYAVTQSGSFGWQYFCWVLMALIGHGLVHMWPTPPKTPSVKLHMHHWYWSFFASHFAIFDSSLSCTAQALFLGVYIHGAACFGLESIFEDDQPQPSCVEHKKQS